jgi:hypothetical protein
MTDKMEYVEVVSPSDLKVNQYTTHRQGGYVSRPAHGLLERIAVRAWPESKPDARMVAYQAAADAIIGGPMAISKFVQEGGDLNATNLDSLNGTSNLAAAKGPIIYEAFLLNGGKPDNSLYCDRVASDAYHLISKHGISGLRASKCGSLTLDDPKKYLSYTPSYSLQATIIIAGVETIEAYVAQGGKFFVSHDLIKGINFLTNQSQIKDKNFEEDSQIASAALKKLEAVTGKTIENIKAEVAEKGREWTKKAIKTMKQGM